MLQCPPATSMINQSWGLMLALLPPLLPVVQLPTK
jgi:hypothetical protein